MESITRFITQKLKLKVNQAKSAVARPQERKFLGFSFTAGPDIRHTIAPKSLERFKQRIRDITRRAKGVSITATMEELALYMRGWRNYFGFCETPEVLVGQPDHLVRQQFQRPMGAARRRARARGRHQQGFLLTGELALRAGTWLFAQRPFQVAFDEASLGPVDRRSANPDTQGDILIADPRVRGQ
jgi:RNA-directed DNA polymerase